MCIRDRYKIDPDTMATVASWAGQASGDAWAEAIQYDFQSERLLVLEDRNLYRITKLRPDDLSEEMHKDAESGWPPSQWHGNDLTILGDYFYVATGGTPGAIVKRRISDLEMVDYFEGTIDDPDDYIEGIFFNLCNDGEYLYTATYDYREERPTRLIKVNPLDMTRAGTYYGVATEMMAYGSCAYGGKVYMLLMGWDGVYWPDHQEGEHVLQIDPTTMTKTAELVNWTGEWTDAVVGVGDGSRLHLAFWGESIRSVLQFAEEGTPLCIVCGKVAVGDKVFLLPIGNFFGNVVALKSDIFSTSDKAFLASLDEKKDLKLAFKSCTAKTNDKVICLPIEGMKENIVALR